MDKRSWPWKKKLSDKLSMSNESEQSSPSQSARHLDNQVLPALMSDSIRVSDAAMPQLQADEKIKHLNEKLLAADHLVKQHVKVAEEAVSGWEKAKAENMSLKHQLEICVEQKQASDDRASQLDAALKDCMRQLRQIREQQEQVIHGAIVKGTRDWENLRLELEQRLANADHQLVEAEYQNSLLHKAAKEQADMVAELSQVRCQVEAGAEMLQARMEIFEKENRSLKYELNVLNKELEIRNQEREINKKSLDVASRQKVEAIKRINKLEAECQRLRVLVRKKLPGPGALLQMKLEAGGSDDERGSVHLRGRSHIGKAAGSPKAAVYTPEPLLSSESALSERILTMEEETKMLKEALAKRNGELEEARLMCAQMADKFSTLDCLPVAHLNDSPRKFAGSEAFLRLGFRQGRSQAALSEDFNDDQRSVADSWSSSLISELRNFPPEPSKLHHSQLGLNQLDSMDDFIEMERLVSLPASEALSVELNAERELLTPRISGERLAKEAELQAANTLCAEVKRKLVTAEEQFDLLSSKNASNELNLFSLQQKLSMILEAQNGMNPEKALECVRDALVESRCSSMAGLHAQVLKLSKTSSPSIRSETPPSFQRSPDHQNPVNGNDSVDKVGPRLGAEVQNIVRLIEVLASQGLAEQPSKQIASGLDKCFKSLHTICEQCVEGKVDLGQFIAELSSVLGELETIDPPTSESLASIQMHKGDASKDAEQEVFSDAGSPFSNLSTHEGSEQPSAKVSSSMNSKVPPFDEDLRKIRAEKAALESHMRAELSRMDKVEGMLAQLKQEKSQLVAMLEEEKEKVETLKAQIQNEEQLVANLRVRLASAELSRSTAEGRVTAMTAENAKLSQESQLELTRMHEKLKSIESREALVHERNEELQAKVGALQELLQRAHSSGLQASRGPCTEQVNNKEGEIADATETLAECQRTILILGKQLQEIASARASLSVSFNSSAQDMDEDGLWKDGSVKTGSSNLGLDSRHLKQRARSGTLCDVAIPEVTDDELIFAAKSRAQVEGSPSHEDYIQAISQMPSSPDADTTDTKLVPYVPKLSPRKKTLQALTGAIDLTKSSNSPKRGSSFSRFFSRHKKPAS